MNAIAETVQNNLRDWSAEATTRNTERHEALVERVNALINNQPAQPDAEVARMNLIMNDIEGKINTLEQADLGINFVPFHDNNDDPHTWLRTFESCCEFRGYDDAKAIKAMKL